jgi:hypothetical protein
MSKHLVPYLARDREDDDLGLLQKNHIIQPIINYPNHCDYQIQKN